LFSKFKCEVLYVCLLTPERTPTLNIESGQIDPNATGGLNIESGQNDPKATQGLSTDVCAGGHVGILATDLR